MKPVYFFQQDCHCRGSWAWLQECGRPAGRTPFFCFREKSLQTIFGQQFRSAQVSLGPHQSVSATACLTLNLYHSLESFSDPHSCNIKKNIKLNFSDPRPKICGISEHFGRGPENLIRPARVKLMRKVPLNVSSRK